MRLLRRSAQVRRGGHILELQEGVVGRYGFLREDIDRCAGDRALPQRLGQRRLVHDSASRGVDQVGRRLQRRELSRTDEATRLIGQRTVNRDDIRFLEQVGERHELDTRLLRSLLRQVRIITEHPHTERPRPLRHLGANTPRSHEAEGLPVQLNPPKTAPLPRTTAERGVGRGDVTNDRQHERQRVLSG